MNTMPTPPVSPGEEPEAAPRRRAGRVAATVTALTLAVGGSVLVPALAEPGAAPAEDAAADSSECTVSWHATFTVTPDGNSTVTNVSRSSDENLIQTHSEAYPYLEEGTREKWEEGERLTTSLGVGTREDLTDLQMTTSLKADGMNLYAYGYSGVYEDGYTSYNLMKTDMTREISPDGKTMTGKVTQDGKLPAKSALDIGADTDVLPADSPLVGTDTPVVVDMDLTAQKASCAEPTAPAEGTATYTYDDGAVLQIPATWTRGEDLHLTGTGFTTSDGASGSTVAVKLNSGGISRKTAVPGQKNKTIWALGQADDQGNLSIDVPFPTMEDSDLDAELPDNESVDITLLTGSLKAGDKPRGGIPGSTRVVPAAAEPSPSASASAEPTTPAPSETASPSASATPTTSAEPTETAAPSPTTSAQPTETASPTTSAQPTETASPTTSASPEPTTSAEPTPAAEELSHTYDDGATVTWSSIWEYGKPLTLKGTGFLTKDKTAGSTVALKLNSGGINHLTPVEGQKNASIWVVAEADAQGNFTVQAPFPTTENSDLDAALEPGEAVDLTLLTGSLKAGDVVRGGSVGETTVGPRADTTDPSATPEPTATATASPSQSAQPTAEPSDSTDPSASAEPTVEETEIVVTEPEATEEATTDQTAAEEGTVTEDQICEDLGVTDISTDDPQYTEARDRDSDGVACESGNGNGMSGSDDGAAGYGDGSGTGAAGSSSSGDLASTGASQNTGLMISGGIFVLTAGAALVILARRRATR